MGWLLGLPLKLLSLLGGILMVVLRFALPVLIGVGAAMLLRRYRRGKTDEEAASWKKPEEPTFDGPVYTVDYQEVQPVSDTPDRPLPFGYKTIWMVAASQDPQQVIRALGGRDICRANWQTGLQAAAEEANCVFVSPCLDGFVLVIGLPRFPEQGLAGAFRQVQAFATHRVTEYHAWARWDSGTLERMYVYDGSRGVVTVQTGELTAQEIALGFGRFPQKGREDRCEANPTEEDVLDLAAAWGVDPRMEAAAYPPSAGWICTVR